LTGDAEDAHGDDAPAGGRGDWSRVVEAQRQARRSLAVAGAFAVGAPLAALLPTSTGTWLPLHLFLVGGLLNAISGATQLLAVTWSASPAPSRRVTSLQRWMLAAGAVAIAGGRELGERTVSVAGSSAVAAALVVLGASLWRIRTGAVTRRFAPATDTYLLAVGAGIFGTLLAIGLVTGEAGTRWTEVRAAHLTLNVFGLVGLTIAGTLPYFVATQARTKMSPRATPGRLQASSVWLLAAAGAAAGAHLLDRPVLAGIALAAYAAGLVALTAMLPIPTRRQLGWAGPRLLQLGAGMVWWIATTALLAVSVIRDHTQHGPILRALVIGGFAQILLASLAYFGPVLRGGGHELLGAGFAVTRSWTGLVAANVAAAGALAALAPVVAAGLAVWVGDTVVRAVRFARQPATERTSS
jgi:hypothetical protein